MYPSQFSLAVLFLPLELCSKYPKSSRYLLLIGLVTTLLIAYINVLELGSYLGCADWVKYPFEKLVSILCLNLPPVTKPVFPSPVSQSRLIVNAKKIGAASLLFVPVGASAVYIVILRSGRGRGETQRHRGHGERRAGEDVHCTKPGADYKEFKL